MRAIMAIPAITQSAKVLAPVLLYCLTDYCYSKYHYARRFVYPIPASFGSIAHAILLLALFIAKYFLTRSFGLPKITTTSFVASASLAVLLQYDVLDLNHNFGVPSYKTITAVLLPLVLMFQGAEPMQCCGVFGAMLLSAFAGSHHYAVTQMVTGAMLSGVFYLCLISLKKYKSESQTEFDQLNQDSRIKFFLDIAINILTGVVVSDIVLIYFDSNMDAYSGFGVTGIILLTVGTIGKMVILYYVNDHCILAMMLAWVIKTLMFSMTYTLRYKFDLTISNLLAAILWIIYIISVNVLNRFSESKPKLYTPLIIHHD